jgi:hypothetical protein
MAHKKILKNLLIEHWMSFIIVLTIECNTMLIVWFQVLFIIAQNSRIDLSNDYVITMA